MTRIGSCLRHKSTTGEKAVATAWALPTELVWTKKDGSEGYYRLPPSLSQMLTTRLTSYKTSHATWAMRLAMVLMTAHGGDMRPFYVDRRAIAGHDREDGKPRRVSALLEALSMTEWQVRTARYLLRAIGFIAQDHDQRRDQEENPKALWRRTSAGMRRAPTLFRLGADFSRTLFAAIKRSHFTRYGILPRPRPYTLPSHTRRVKGSESSFNSGSENNMGVGGRSSTQNALFPSVHPASGTTRNPAVQGSCEILGHIRHEAPSASASMPVKTASDTDRRDQIALEAVLAKLGAALGIKP